MAPTSPVDARKETQAPLSLSRLTQPERIQALFSFPPSKETYAMNEKWIKVYGFNFNSESIYIRREDISALRERSDHIIVQLKSGETIKAKKNQPIEKLIQVEEPDSVLSAVHRRPVFYDGGDFVMGQFFKDGEWVIEKMGWFDIGDWIEKDLGLEEAAKLICHALNEDWIDVQDLHDSAWSGIQNSDLLRTVCLDDYPAAEFAFGEAHLGPIALIDLEENTWRYTTVPEEGGFKDLDEMLEIVDDEIRTMLRQRASNLKESAEALEVERTQVVRLSASHTPYLFAGPHQEKDLLVVDSNIDDDDAIRHSDFAIDKREDKWMWRQCYGADKSVECNNSNENPEKVWTTHESLSFNTRVENGDLIIEVPEGTDPTEGELDGVDIETITNHKGYDE